MPEPEITPCIAELLRTRYIPSHLLLRVERVVDVPVVYAYSYPDNNDNDNENEPSAHEPADDENHKKEEGSCRRHRHRTFRLFLSDSEFLVQALLMRELHHFVGLGEVVPGCVMRVEKFRLRWAERTGTEERGFEHESGAGAGRIAYLAVERFRTVWMPPGARGGGGELSRSVECGETLVKKKRDGRGGGDAASEGKPVNNAKYDPEGAGIDSREDGRQKQKPPANETPTTAISVPRLQDRHQDQDQGHNFPPIPNLLTLSTLLNPPHPIPQRNYTISVLAIIASISPHTRKPPPHTRLPPKRDLRLVDASLPFRSSGVQLSVFRDAEGFVPPVGTMGLFVGLKTHEWEGVSLNVFESAAQTQTQAQAARGEVVGEGEDDAGEEWFVDDRDRLRSAGFDVARLESWWAERCAVLGG